MALIMENFRRYTNEEDIERVYLLEEGKVHKETKLSTLIEMRDNGEIDTLQLVDLINESAEYEVEQLLLEQEQPSEPGASKPAARGKGMKYAFREKILTFMYSKVGAHLKATFGQDKKAVGGIQKRLSQAKSALQNGNVQEALKLLSVAAFKAVLKPIALLVKALGKIVKGILAIVGKLGPIFKHPLVRLILIGALCVTMFQAVTMGTAVVAGLKVVNQAAALATGKTAIAHGVGAAGQSAMGALREEVQLNEAEDLINIASILGDLELDSLGAAIIAAAAKLENVEVLDYNEMTELEYLGPDGELIQTVKAVFTTADEALGAQMDSIGIMKTALNHIQRGGELEELGGVPEAVGEAMKAAATAAKLHCQSDPAACAGAEQLANTIQEIWSGTVHADHFDMIIQDANGVTELVHQFSQSVGVSSVAGGQQAAAALGLGT